jgi:hypothetical protein
VTSVKFTVSLMPQHQYTRHYIKFGNNLNGTVSTSNVHTQMLLDISQLVREILCFTPYLTCKRSNGASIGVFVNSLQLARSGVYSYIVYMNRQYVLTDNTCSYLTQRTTSLLFLSLRDRCNRFELYGTAAEVAVGLAVIRPYVHSLV